VNFNRKLRKLHDVNQLRWENGIVGSTPKFLVADTTVLNCDVVCKATALAHSSGGFICSEARSAEVTVNGIRRILMFAFQTDNG
jgi:hypothetical protein